MSTKHRILSFVLVLLFTISATGIRPVIALEAPTELYSQSVTLSDSALPSAVTLVGSEHLPPIANQGAVGCCASMAATYLQFTNAYSRYLHSIDPDTDFHPATGLAKYNFSPRFTYNLAGSGTAWVYEVLKEQGTVLQTYSVFSGGVTGAASDDALANDWATIENYWTEAMKYRISDYDQVWMSNYDFQLTTTTKGKELLSRIKSALNDGNVIVTGGYPDRWDYTTVVNGGTYGKRGEQVIYRSTDRSSGGHQVAIVGYDDNLTCKVNGITLKGAFLVANSWGTSWKNSGYTWVMYDAINQSSEYPSLNHSTRQWTLDQFVFLDWKTDLVTTRPALSAKIEVTTADRNGFSVTLTRTDAIGNTESYVPYIVRNENLMPKYNEGLNFYGKTGSATGYLNYNFSTLLDLPQGTDYDDYVWGITVTADNGKTLTLGTIELLDENGNAIYQKNVSQTLSSGESENYPFSDLCIVRADLPTGATLETTSGNALCEKGEQYSFTVQAADGFKASDLTVTANGKRLSSLDGIYTLTVNENTVIKVTGICPENDAIETGWYGTGFENWSGKYLLLVLVDNKYLAPAIYANEASLNSGNYPYYFRVTIDGNQTYYFTPHSFYHFSDSTLYRLPVVDQGWIPQKGITYNFTIEVCTENDVLYSATNKATCGVSIEQSYTTHTHSYTSNRYILVHEGDCSHSGSYDRFCNTSTCRAAKTFDSGMNSLIHSEKYSVTVDPTPLTDGSYTIYCSDCQNELSKEILDKVYPENYDMDRSGAINISDVNAMLTYLSTYESTTEEDLAIYDLDGNGTVSVSDLNVILIYLSKIA